MTRAPFELISRAEAKALGLTRYFTGEPCKHGHIAKRSVADARCFHCSKASNDLRRKLISRAAPASKGVHWDGKSWIARIMTNGVRAVIGRFSSEAEAAAAYEQAKRAMYTLTCRICGKAFEARSKNSFFCSRRCKQDASNIQTRRWRADNPWYTEMVNALNRLEHKANARPRKKPVFKALERKHCIVCEKEFWGPSWGRYCCKRCRRIALCARKKKHYAEDAEHRAALLARIRKRRHGLGEDFRAHEREYRRLNFPRFRARAKREREHMKEWVTTALEDGFKPQALSSGRPTRKIDAIYADLRSLRVVPTLKGKY